jgi:Response regulators consisting of a CheY-like receiver domain and a winged-helix DNA-binding domain
MKKTVLLVEDEQTLSTIIIDTLEDEGFRTVYAKNGEDGLKMFFAEHPDVVIADVMMPRMDGFQMVKNIRKSEKSTPVLFLTARSSLDDLIEGFESGANDYLKKPFNMKELIIRVKALADRVVIKEPEKQLYVIGDYHFDPISQLLTYVGKKVELSHMENEILKRLCMNQNDIIDFESILIELWHDNSFYNRNSLHGFIHKLRRLLSSDKKVKILNIRGYGYKLIVDAK